MEPYAQIIVLSEQLERNKKNYNPLKIRAI